MEKAEVPVFLRKTTANYHVYEAADGSVIKYVKKSRLPKTPPDVLMDATREVTAGDTSWVRIGPQQ